MAKKKRSAFCRCAGVSRTSCRMKKGYVARKGGSCPVKIGKSAKASRRQYGPFESKAARKERVYHGSGRGYASGFERWKAEQAAAAASMPMLNGFGRARGRRRFGRRFF